MCLRGSSLSSHRPRIAARGRGCHSVTVAIVAVVVVLSSAVTLSSPTLRGHRGWGRGRVVVVENGGAVARAVM